MFTILIRFRTIVFLALIAMVAMRIYFNFYPAYTQADLNRAAEDIKNYAKTHPQSHP
jgi:anionic cell wall polymer biosynthesis LytR-Cps2A-Psr (LCP) family protein